MYRAFLIYKYTFISRYIRSIVVHPTVVRKKCSDEEKMTDIPELLRIPPNSTASIQRALISHDSFRYILMCIFCVQACLLHNFEFESKVVFFLIFQNIMLKKTIYFRNKLIDCFINIDRKMGKYLLRFSEIFYLESITKTHRKLLL